MERWSRCERRHRRDRGGTRRSDDLGTTTAGRSRLVASASATCTALRSPRLQAPQHRSHRPDPHHSRLRRLACLAILERLAIPACLALLVALPALAHPCCPAAPRRRRLCAHTRARRFLSLTRSAACRSPPVRAHAPRTRRERRLIEQEAEADDAGKREHAAQPRRHCGKAAGHGDDADCERGEPDDPRAERANPAFLHGPAASYDIRVATSRRGRRLAARNRAELVRPPRHHGC
jgi:hypothetical protein